VAARAGEGGTADGLELARLRSALEAVVAENGRLAAINDRLRVNIGERRRGGREGAPPPPRAHPVDYMPDARLAKEDMAMLNDQKKGGAPVADFFYRPRAKARHEQAIGWGEAQRTTVQGALSAPGTWWTPLGEHTAWRDDEELVRAIDKARAAARLPPPRLPPPL
jgi:hypothetical protein